LLKAANGETAYRKTPTSAASYREPLAVAHALVGADDEVRGAAAVGRDVLVGRRGRRRKAPRGEYTRLEGELALFPRVALSPQREVREAGRGRRGRNRGYADHPPIAQLAAARRREPQDRAAQRRRRGREAERRRQQPRVPEYPRRRRDGLAGPAEDEAGAAALVEDCEDVRQGRRVAEREHGGEGGAPQVQF